MSLLCPRCRVGLQERPAHELVIKGCLRCGGVWLDNAGVARLGEALSRKTLAAVDLMASTASHQGDETRPIDCPQCAEILIRTQLPKAEVTIDRCPDHGAWYDRNELQQVARALGTAPPRTAPQPPPKSAPKSAPKTTPKAPPAPPVPTTRSSAFTPIRRPPDAPPAVSTQPNPLPGTLWELVGLIIEVGLSFV